MEHQRSGIFIREFEEEENARYNRREIKSTGDARYCRAIHLLMFWRRQLIDEYDRISFNGNSTQLQELELELKMTSIMIS